MKAYIHSHKGILTFLSFLYNSDKNTFNYLIDHQGKVDTSQEALGLSFAVMFGIIDGEKAKQLVKNAVVSKYGITSITPDFPWYPKEMPGDITISFGPW
jgi:hypothetical protein